jgi:ATP-dependent DNA ligase
VRTRGYERIEEGNEEQAQASKRQKVLDLDGDDDNESAALESPLPMLADKYEDHEDKISDDAEIFIQPKLDGIRCMAHLPTGKLYSRQRKPIDRLPHIEEAVRTLGQRAKGLEWLDGELYVHGMAFQDVQRLVRGADPDGKTRYNVYDTVLNKPFHGRNQLLSKLELNGLPITLVPTERSTKAQVDGTLQRWLDAKYEGCMVRIGTKGYELNKRSTSLLKCKRFDQAEFIIVDLEAQKRTADKLGAFVLRLDDGTDTTVKAGPGADMSATAKQELWQQRNALVGQIATVKFFERHASGIPRFPKVLGIRHPDDM